MKYVVLSLILFLIFPIFNQPAHASTQTPTIFFCVGNNPQPPCATQAPEPSSDNDQTPSGQPATSITAPASNSQPSPSTNPCVTQSSVDSSVHAFAKKHAPHTHGNLQQFMQFLLQLFQLLFQLLGSQTPTQTPIPTPSSIPSSGPSSAPAPSTNPCASPASPSTAQVSPSIPAPTVFGVSPTVAVAPSISSAPQTSSSPSSSASGVSPSTTPPTNTPPSSWWQQLIQLLQQLLQELQQLLGGQQPCSSNCPTPTPTIAGTPATSPSTSTAVSPSIAILPTQAASSSAKPGKPGIILSLLNVTGSKTHNLCVDDRANSSTDNNPVQAWMCLGDTAQTWTPYSDGTVRINGKCLDAGQGATSGTTVAISTCTGATSQVWTFSKITKGQATGKTEVVNKASNLCLDIPGSATGNGTQLDVATCNGDNNQAWSWATRPAKWAYVAPTGLKVTSVTTTSVSVSWSAVTGTKPVIPGGVSNPASYTIAVYNKSTGKLIKQITSKTTTATVTGLTAGTAITINVWANGSPTAPPHASVTTTLTKSTSSGGGGTTTGGGGTTTGGGVCTGSACTQYIGKSCTGALSGYKCEDANSTTYKNYVKNNQGSFTPGYCPGPSNIQCWIPAYAPQPPKSNPNPTTCAGLGGVCVAAGACRAGGGCTTIGGTCSVAGDVCVNPNTCAAKGGTCIPASACKTAGSCNRITASCPSGDACIK